MIRKLQFVLCPKNLIVGVCNLQRYADVSSD